MKRFFTLLLVGVIGFLSACGGGSSSTDPLPQGVYQGTGFYPNASGEFLTVMQGNEIWTRYANGDEIGFIFGIGTISNGAIQSPLLVYTGSGILGELTGSVANSVFSGNALYATAPETPISFSGTTPTGYNYNTPAQAVTGSWRINGNGVGIDDIPVTVDIAGNFTGTDNGCSFSGSIVPHENGKNIYQLAVTFTDTTPDACLYAGTLAGVGVALTEGSAPKVYLMAVSADRTAGAVITAEPVLPPT